MSRLAELIAQLCPDGVEYRALGDVAELKRGEAVTRKEVVEGQVPVIAGGREPAYYIDRSNRQGETIVIAGSGAYAGFVSFWDEPIFVSDAFSIVVDRSVLQPRFVYHWLSGRQEAIHALKSGGGVPHVYPKDVAKLRCPVPPLEVQREIVRILDQFTTLEAELEAELEARRTQYVHYRTHLLSYESLAARGPVSWIPLREFGVWSGGGTPSKSRADYWDEGNIPWITPKDMRSSKIQNSMMNVTDRAVRESNVKLIEAPSIALVVRSSILQHTFPVAQINVDATFNQDMKTLVVDSDRFERRYIYYALSANGQEILRQTSKQGGSVNSLVVPRLMDFKVPVPAFDEQQRIADLLDRFDALVNDISSGLPAEIAARRAQYEHYRDRLLSFPEKVVSVSDAS